MSVSVVLKNVCQRTGEGPHWEESTKSLLFLDLERGGIHKWNSIDNTHTKFEAGGNVGVIIPRESGGYIISYFAQLADFDWESQQMKRFITVESDKPGNRFNDGKYDSYGRLWTAREQVVFDFEGKELLKSGIPDGMTTDENDKIWLATFTNQILQIDPETGKIITSIKFPTSQITSCCFGGSNDELYVTSSADDLTEKQLQNEEKFAGSVFKVTGLEAKGLAAHIFQG